MKFVSQILILFITSVSFAQNWPQFRGSAALGSADKQNLPSTWDVQKSSNILWKMELPGTGHSSPVIWKNTIYVTTAVGSPTNWRDDSVKHS
ncbi:MAG TPA: hypothetical protein VLH08_23075, partial [Acidobacteriota bacterium]|nr:hypothetical protein [Acidobacteriota bacterium]